MIVILPDALFQEQPTDDLLLFGIFDEQNGRYKVQIRPPYLPRGTTAFTDGSLSKACELKSKFETFSRGGPKRLNMA